MEFKKLGYEAKEKMVALSGACFWYWESFHSFLSSCGVPRKLITRYPKGTFSKYTVMRNILDDLEDENNIEVIQNIISNFYRLSSAIDKDILDNEKAKRLLSEFKEIVGNDPIERAVKQEKWKEKKAETDKEIEESRLKLKKREQLKERFMKAYSEASFTPQQRGFELERIFYDLLELEEFDYTKSYRKPGEQIDGTFSFNKFDYLVEIKWIKEKVSQNDLSIFDGKIKDKAQSTRGLVLAVNGFDENAINKISGNSPRIILMDGHDFLNILDGRRTFSDCLRFKIDALVRFGTVFKKE